MINNDGDLVVGFCTNSTCKLCGIGIFCKIVYASDEYVYYDASTNMKTCPVCDEDLDIINPELLLTVNNHD